MLSDKDRAILAFEEANWETGRWEKEGRVRRRLGLTLTRYNQRLASIAQEAEALAEYPQLIYRVRARIEARVQRRGGALISREA